MTDNYQVLNKFNKQLNRILSQSNIKYNFLEDYEELCNGEYGEATVTFFASKKYNLWNPSAIDFDKRNTNTYKNILDLKYIDITVKKKICVEGVEAKSIELAAQYLLN